MGFAVEHSVYTMNGPEWSISVRTGVSICSMEGGDECRPVVIGDFSVFCADGDV